MDLTICPDEIRALDPHADEAWSLFLKKTGISMSVDGKRVLDNESRRAQIIRNFGVPSLIQRLAAARTEVERARVWWREAAACSEGDGIPDLSGDNLYVLNAFIFDPALKFTDRRVEAMRAGRPRKSDEEKRAGTALPRLQSRRPANVTQQADAAFLDELKNTDKVRYDRLTASIQQGEGGDMPPVCWVEPADSRCLCGASLVGKRRGAKWCSDVCRMRLGRQNNPKTRIQNKGVADAKNCFPVDRPTLSENGLSRTNTTPANLGQTDARAAEPAAIEAEATSALIRKAAQWAA